MEWALLVLLIVNLLLLALLLLRRPEELSRQVSVLATKLDAGNQAVSSQVARSQESLLQTVDLLADNLLDSQERELDKMEAQLDKINMNLNERFQTVLEAKMTAVLTNMDTLGQRLSSVQDQQRQMTVSELAAMRTELKDSLSALRKENQESLDRINGTVNEKLQKTLDERISQSFETVSQRLREVHEGLGEMKSVAAGVTDLKNVLANVKTRGTLGEVQLAAILEEILPQELFASQIPVVAGSREKVDFAVKLPGNGEGGHVLLPIDSKFPGDTYAAFLAACESGDAAQVKQCRSRLESEIKRCAKDIAAKYIRPPYTTNFAILFLPFEGLYAEVVNLGLLETLQNQHHISIAGPSTMAAMLNSLQMGFRTLQIQKKSGEVWQVLEAAKAEFAKFETVLDSVRKRLNQADQDLEKLVGTRTQEINKSLRHVGQLEQS